MASENCRPDTTRLCHTVEMHRVLLFALVATLAACNEAPTAQPAVPATATMTGSSTPPAPPTASSSDVMILPPGVTGEEVRYQAGGLELVGYIAYNATLSSQRPGVLVVHEWWGHNDYVRRRARVLAALGYTAFALDMYGGGKNTTHPKEAGKFAKEAKANMAIAKARFDAARKVLEAHRTTDPRKTAAIGYCFGGGIVIGMARMGLDLAGVASFHGSLGTEWGTTRNSSPSDTRGAV